MEELNSCPVCKNQEIKKQLDCVDYTTTKEVFNINQCEVCSFRFTNPRPNIKESGKYYQSEDYISHTDSKKGLLNKLYQIARDYMIATKYKSTVKHYNAKTLVDYGCGTGDFLKYCIDKGITATGLEIDAGARKIAIEKGCKDVFEPEHLSSLKDQSADIITLWHVLEHIHNLDDVIDNFKRVLKDNGSLVIAVPNHQSYDESVYGKYWAAYDVPRHLYHFNIQSMAHLMNRHGFKLIQTKSMKLDPFYIALLSNKYKAGSLNPLKSVVVGIIGNVKSLINIKNSSSIIYIFKKQ